MTSLKGLEIISYKCGKLGNFNCMKRIYMYPKNDYKTLESPNPYVLNVEKSLSEKHRIINETPNTSGVMEFFMYLRKSDVYFFNWIEDVSIKRYGKIQAILFPVFLVFARLFRKKIVWVLHNLYSHEKRNRSWTRFGFKLMIRHSDLIITHSKEGVEFVRKNFPRQQSKVKYIIHPVDELLISDARVEKKYDFLIWGTIHPYKGVIEFLEYVLESEGLRKYKILISGICPHDDLKMKLDSCLNERIEHRDGFFDIEEIAEMTNQSRYTLFTYNSSSILSSGSLMDSIRMGAMIIGPDKGAFRDLKDQIFVSTYKNYDELLKIVEQTEDMEEVRINQLKRFCQQNSWSSFGKKLFAVSGDII